MQCVVRQAHHEGIGWAAREASTLAANDKHPSSASSVVTQRKGALGWWRGRCFFYALELYAKPIFPHGEPTSLMGSLSNHEPHANICSKTRILLLDSKV
jgi:hypothetical protein